MGYMSFEYAIYVPVAHYLFMSWQMRRENTPGAYAD